MPGYEKLQFVSLSQTEEDELSCGICFGIFINPMVTPCCRQTYCKECIHEWLNQNNTCPNDRSSLKSEGLLQPPRLVINLLNKLKIRCSFLENGCNQIVLIEKLSQHLNCCKHNPEGICIECGVKNGDRNLHNCIENLLSKIILIEKLKREAFQKHELLEKQMQQNKEESIQVNNELMDLRKKIFHMNGDNQKLKQSNNDLKAEISRVENDRAICEDTIDKLSKVNTDLVNGKREINQKLEKMIELNNSLENMIRIRDNFIEEIKILEENKDSLLHENEKISESKQRLKKSISSLNTQNVKFTEEIKSLKQMSAKLKSENLKLIKYNGENDKLLKSNNCLKTEIDEVKNDLKQSKKLYNDIYSGYCSMASEIEVLNTNNEKLLNLVKLKKIEHLYTIKKLRIEFEDRFEMINVKTLNNFDNYENMLESINTETDEKLSKLEDDIRVIKIYLDNLHNINLNLEDKNSKLVNETENFKKRINDWVSRYEIMRIECQSIRTEKTNIEEQLEYRNWLLYALTFLILSLIFIIFFNPISR